MQRYKRYVDVIVHISKDGKQLPLYIYWDERGVQQKFKIDKILEIRHSASCVGGCGILYRCRILGQERNLFYERNRYFIESERP